MSDLANVTRQPLRGMITLRGDLVSGAVKKAIKGACGQAVPKAGQILGDDEGAAIWMSPDELLILVPYDAVDDTVAGLEKALAKAHALVVDVSDARALFRIEGADAHEVLARVCPVDLHADSFRVGQFRRTRLAQVAAAFWRHDRGFDVICFLSVADYVAGVLGNAAKGAKVGALD